MISVLLVDDHAVLRAGLRSLLDAEPDITVVGEASCGEQAIDLVPERKPNVVVMDLSMPGIGGLEATRRIRALDTGCKVIVLTMHSEQEHLGPVIEAGASGYLTKTRADRELVEGLRVVAQGGAYMPPEASTYIVDRYVRRAEQPAASELKRLSRREREVLTLTAEGFTAVEIGGRLGVSPKTVDTYRSRVMRKLEIAHRSELVRFALRTGLLKVH